MGFEGVFQMKKTVFQLIRIAKGKEWRYMSLWKIWVLVRTGLSEVDIRIWK